MGKTKNFIRGLCLVLVGIAACYDGALAAPVSTDEREAIVLNVAKVYTSQIGVRELTGHNDGVEVETYLAVTGFGKGYSWCAAFVSWTYQEAGVKALKNAWAPSWFPAERVIFQKGKPIKIKPDKADVFGIYKADLKRIAHVGFIDSWPPGDYTITVEGNTNNAGSREGDGVYRKRRLKANIDRVSRWVDRSITAAKVNAWAGEQELLIAA